MSRIFLASYELLLYEILESVEYFASHLYYHLTRWDGELEARAIPEALDYIFNEKFKETNHSVARTEQQMLRLRQIIKFPEGYPQRFTNPEIDFTVEQLVQLELQFAHQQNIPIVCFNTAKHERIRELYDVNVDIGADVDICNIVTFFQSCGLRSNLHDLVHQQSSFPALDKDSNGLSLKPSSEHSSELTQPRPEDPLPITDAEELDLNLDASAQAEKNTQRSQTRSSQSESHHQKDGPLRHILRSIIKGRVKVIGDGEENLSPSSLPSIPPEVLWNSQDKLNDPDKYHNFYSEIEVEQKPMNEAKVLLVGQSSVGKTSLARRLVKGTFNLNEHKTEGINVQKWLVPINGQKIQLNVWDFGGQEIMHTTHQFFLTKRSLYLLVLDARLEQEENRLEYWLKMIQSFGGNSPIIIVGNKIDQQPLDIDRQGLQNKYFNIKAFVETSCRDDIGIEELKQTITEEITHLKHIHDVLPLSWSEVKTCLERLDRDYIHYSEYERLCVEQAVAQELSQRTLISLLHDLGVVLNYQEDDRLYDTNVLKPEWITNGVYKILNDRNLILEHKGILKRQQLDQILDPQRYPRQKHLFIIDLMRKFELCFDIEADQQFLIPNLLPKEESYTGDWQDALAFEYHYPVLPDSIISRFIVRMSDKIHRRTYWRNGVVLVYEGNKALVKADREDRKIFIWVNGNQNTRRNFLTAIRAQFASIHRTFPGLEVEQKVLIPNHPNAAPVDYQHLLDLEDLGETSFIPPGLKIRVNVKQLLDGIELEQDRSRLQRGFHEAVNINIQNSNSQENQPVSSINQHGLGDNIAGDKVMGDKINTQINHSQNLAQAARDIEALLAQLSADYPSDSEVMLGARAVDRIKENPALKQRVVKALKEAGATALEKLVDHPAVSIVVAGAKGFMDAE